MQLFNRYVSTRSLTVFGAELLLIFGSVALAATVQGTTDVAASFWKIGLVTVICQLCLYYNDFYDLTLVHSRRELIVRLLPAVGAASIILALPYVAIPSLTLGAGLLGPALFFLVIGIPRRPPPLPPRPPADLGSGEGPPLPPTRGVHAALMGITRRERNS